MDHPRRRLLHDLWRGAAAGTALAAGLPAGAAAPATTPATEAAGRKVLRLAFSNAESTLDPARISDLYSRAITAHIFEALYAYDHLAPGALLVPLTAAALPEVSDNHRRFTIRLQRGIRFADDPAFGGRPRELVAADYVFALQRVVDPANLSPVAAEYLELGILGLGAAREAALKAKAPFDYSRPIEGLATPDPYTLVIRTAEPRPRLAYFLADSSVTGAQAREVVQRYGETLGEHPVGTGPFRLKRWRRSSQLVLERNPGYRERFYSGHPAPDDAEGQAWLQRFQGRRLPMVDEVEVTIVPEDQPRWLTFLNAQVDALATSAGSMPGSYVPQAAPGGKLAPNLARRGIQLRQQLNADSAYLFFNMRDPTVGGLEPPQVALRRAVSLGYNVPAEIQLARRGLAVPAQSSVPPHCLGYDPAFKSEMGDYDPARANALLDLYGYADRNRDGWRERPDGSPLELVVSTEPEQIYRTFNEVMDKSMKALGIRVRFRTQQWTENYKAAEAGTLMMWMLGGSASQPDGIDALAHLSSNHIGSGNFAGFKLPAFDALFDQLQSLPDGPERDAVFRQAKRLAAAYMPYKTLVHRVSTDLIHPWVTGFRRPRFANEWWHQVDLDPAMRAARTGA